MARLGDIATVITKGTTPTSIGFAFENDGINFVKIESVDENGNFICEKFDHISDECHEKLKRSQLQENDILFSIAGAIGRTAIVTKDILPANTNQALAIIRIPQGAINYSFLLYILQSSVVLEQAEKKKQGVAQLNLSLKDIGDFIIPDIPLEEQQCIVDSLDKVSNLISLRKQQLSKLDELVKSRFIELFEKEEYKKVTVSSVLNTGFWLMPATPEFLVDGEVPYITSKNIKNRTIDFVNVKYISREAYKSISDNRPTQKGDILISMIGTLGQTEVIQDDREFYGQNLYLLRLNNAIVNTTYFCEFFNSDTAQYELQCKRSQSTQAYLKANHVEDLILPLPPMKLQVQFAAFVEQTDKSKFEIQKSLDKLETLKKALMQKYFG